MLYEEPAVLNICYGLVTEVEGPCHSVAIPLIIESRHKVLTKQTACTKIINTMHRRLSLLPALVLA